jgi:hypothetical protein
MTAFPIARHSRIAMTPTWNFTFFSGVTMKQLSACSWRNSYRTVTLFGMARVATSSVRLDYGDAAAITTGTSRPSAARNRVS